MLSNLQVAELLALETDKAKQPLQRALRRAARCAFLWPVEVAELHRQGEHLTQLSGIGPYLSNLITRWLKKMPCLADAPEIRHDFLTVAYAQAIRRKNQSLFKAIRGDLQMHTTWSDGLSFHRGDG